MRSPYTPPKDWIPDFLDRSPAYRILKEHWPKEYATWPSLAELSARCPAGYSFVPQAPKSSLLEKQYVSQIVHEGKIQTRTRCWHDFFNALTWFTFPQSKKQLNIRMFEAMQKRYEKGLAHRSKTENVGTLLDENGIIFVSSSARLLDMIRRFQWKALFWENRPLLRQTCAPFIFGHALLEKCLTPYIGMTGHAFLWKVDPAFFQQPLSQRCRDIDRKLASLLRNPSTLQQTSELSPFPVLGFPGYTPAAESPSFYDNTQYFRPGRRTRSKK